MHGGFLRGKWAPEFLRLGDRLHFVEMLALPCYLSRQPWENLIF